MKTYFIIGIIGLILYIILSILEKVAIKKGKMKPKEKKKRKLTEDERRAISRDINAIDTK